MTYDVRDYRLPIMGYDRSRGRDNLKGRDKRRKQSIHSNGETHTMESTCLVKKEDVLARLGGDEALLHEIVQMYFEDYPGLLAQVERAIDESNVTTLTQAVHDLKGLLSNFSSRQATAATQSLEQAAKLNQLNDAPARLEVLRQEITRLSIVLNEWLVPS